MASGIGHRTTFILHRSPSVKSPRVRLSLFFFLLPFSASSPLSFAFLRFFRSHTRGDHPSPAYTHAIHVFHNGRKRSEPSLSLDSKTFFVPSPLPLLAHNQSPSSFHFFFTDRCLTTLRFVVAVCFLLSCWPLSCSYFLFQISYEPSLHGTKGTESDEDDVAVWRLPVYENRIERMHMNEQRGVHVSFTFRDQSISNALSKGAEIHRESLPE